ncbi:MAG: FG-GAP repeat domain-containing protein [Candidatus Promineifilaceae bacterium]
MKVKKFQLIAVFLMVIAISIVLAGSRHTFGQEGVGNLFLPVLMKPDSEEHQLAVKFAPILMFDRAHKGLPMSAEDYFQEMLNVPGVSPMTEGDKINWVAERYPQPNPPFVDPHFGEGEPSNYLTIQTADVDGDGRDELLARQGDGMWTYRWTGNSWQLMASGDPPFTDADWGEGEASNYSTIQTADVDGDGRDELLARWTDGMKAYRWTGTSWLLASVSRRTYLCGRDDCQYGMANNDFQSLKDGKVPTYYQVIYNTDGRARITYWWFYGWQPHCNPGMPPAIPYDGKDGAHHGDWEHVVITTTPDREAVEWVTYYFHGAWYTRHDPSPGFPPEGDRWVVLVGKLGHGSYHNQINQGTGVLTPYHCCEYADYRNPISTTIWRETNLNLVNLDENSESWMLADRIGKPYEYEGQMYEIAGWLWGPIHASCNVTVIECVEWEHETAVGTHPTVDGPDDDWKLQSCGGVGCGTDKCENDFLDLPYTYPVFLNQSWPWDTGLTNFISFIEQTNSCRTQQLRSSAVR